MNLVSGDVEKKNYLAEKYNLNFDLGSKTSEELIKAAAPASELDDD